MTTDRLSEQSDDDLLARLARLARTADRVPVTEAWPLDVLRDLSDPSTDPETEETNR